MKQLRIYAKLTAPVEISKLWSYMSMNTVSAATCCYEKDWRTVLTDDFLEKAFSSFEFDFAEKMLLINSKTDRKEIEARANTLKAKGIIDVFWFCEDIKSEVMSAFGLTDFNYISTYRLIPQNADSSGFGGKLKAVIRNFARFYFKKKGRAKFTAINKKEYDCSDYSVGPLCAVHKCSSDYLLYFTEDCVIDKEKTDSAWITDSVNMLDKDPRFLAARPIDMDLDAAYLNEYENADDKFYICYMFTDRMFLARAQILRSVDYLSPNRNKYPDYGGAGFEAKIFNYISAENKRTLIHKNAAYVHEYAEYMNELGM